jgi:hypothetical protein
MLAMVAAQCCGVAHEIATASNNGRFRVVISRGSCFSELPTSQTLRVRWLERDGEWRERGAFELRIENARRLNPHVLVSSAGNGFLLDFGEPEFFGCDGRRWAAWPGLAIEWSQPLDEAGTCAKLAGGGFFFLPLGAPVAGELTRELRVLLRGCPADAAARALVARLSGDSIEDRESARAELVRLGVAAVGALMGAPADAAVEARAILDRVPRWSWLLAEPGRIREVAAMYPTRPDIDEWIEQLGDTDIAVRDRAVAALKRCGRAALPKLEAVSTDDQEVQWRLRAVIAHLRCLRSSRAVLVRFCVDESGKCARTVEACDAAGPRNQIVREGVIGDAESFACVIDTGAPVEWHPDEYDGWRDVVLRDLDRPVDTDVPAVYHLLARVDGFAFALPKLESIRTGDPLVARVVGKAIERQRRKQ